MSRAAKTLIFAADLGGTHLRAATVDQRGKIHFRAKQNTPQGTYPKQIVDAIVNAVRDYRKEVGAAADDGTAVQQAPLP